MVFGPRVVEAIDRGVDGPAAIGAMRSVLGGGEIPGRPLPLPGPSGDQPIADREGLQRTMTLNAGVLRSAESLALAAEGCRSEEHTSELQSLMRISYAVFCLNKTNK